MSRDIRIDAEVEKLRQVLGVSEEELPDNPTQEQLKAAFAGGPRTRAQQHTQRPPDADLPKTLSTDEREAILAQAVADGKFEEARKAHYRTLMEERDPLMIAEAIAQMQPKPALEVQAEVETGAAYPDHWLPEVHAGRSAVTYGND